MVRNYGRGFKAGDAANMSIGQGALLATPLQVAHAFAAIANGRYLPKLHLVRQVLDTNGNVVYQFTPGKQTDLSEFSDALVSVRKGCRSVVSGGSGRRAAISYVDNAGKTGTAQWGRPSDNCRLAWFAGYLPADNPRYAYAALYEGSPNQRISGGFMAAGIVKQFFESVKTSMMAALTEPVRPLPPGLSLPAQEEKPAEGEAAEEEKKEETKPAKPRKPASSGWSDGRSRR